MAREITHRYEDALDRIWIGCAERVGLRIARAPGAYATTDGKGTLTIAIDEELDGDDSLAQMIFHELCHSLVEGPESFERVDWGLDNESDRDELREMACQRVQALLARPHGLGRVLAPTTDFRSFYDALGPDPLEGDDESVVMARRAAARATKAPWAPHLEEALVATAAVARAVGEYGKGERASLWSLVDAAMPRHETGLVRAAAGTRAASETCGTCAWGDRGTVRAHCLQSGVRVPRATGACERWEPHPDCRACGACCREAFDAVMVRPREAMAKKHASLVVIDSGMRFVPRPGGRCVALRGDGASEQYTCVVYEDRPQSCADFPYLGESCLLARRRVGLSR